MSETDKPTLLVIDDEPEILQSLRGLLRREFNLHVAQGAEEALAILAAHPIQVILTDQRMPGMTGVELMAKARKEYPETVRIVFTGYADIKAVVDAINHGGLYRYLTKPWDPDELIEVLQEAAAEYGRGEARRRFNSDVRSFVRDACSLAAGPHPSAADASRWELLHQRGDALLKKWPE